MNTYAARIDPNLANMEAVENAIVLMDVANTSGVKTHAIVNPADIQNLPIIAKLTVTHTWSGNIHVIYIVSSLYYW